MIYILDDEAGKETLHVRGDLHKYLIKVRRHKEGDILNFRSRENIEVLHTYKIESVEPRDAELSLISSVPQEVKKISLGSAPMRRATWSRAFST